MRKKNEQWKSFIRFVARLCIGILIISCVLFYKAKISRAEDGTKIMLSKRNEEDNVPFRAENMFPGDRIEKEFCVNVSCGEEVTVCFGIELDDENQKLAQVLGCRVALSNHGEVLYDGLMTKIPERLEYPFTVVPIAEELVYQITVYLDTSVGNEYQNASLSTKFCWWIEENNSAQETSEDNTTGGIGEETDKETPSVDSGDHASTFKWITIMVVATLLVIVSATLKNRKERLDEKNTEAIL